MNKEISNCIECQSQYYSDSSIMVGLCAECSHQLYNYRNCKHEFKNDRCVKCYWNGNVSKYLKNRKSKCLERRLPNPADDFEQGNED